MVRINQPVTRQPILRDTKSQLPSALTNQSPLAVNLQQTVFPCLRRRGEGETVHRQASPCSDFFFFFFVTFLFSFPTFKEMLYRDYTVQFSGVFSPYKPIAVHVCVILLYITVPSQRNPNMCRERSVSLYICVTNSPIFLKHCSPWNLSYR